MSDARRPTADQEKKFALWRALALARAPHMASLMFKVTPLDLPGLGTMGVDQHMRIYVDFDAVAEWGDKACSEVLVHESVHLLAGHAELAQQAEVPPELRRIWNLCADAAINDDLRDMGLDHIASVGILHGMLKSTGCMANHVFGMRGNLRLLARG